MIFLAVVFSVYLFGYTLFTVYLAGVIQGAKQEIDWPGTLVLSLFWPVFLGYYFVEKGE